MISYVSKLLNFCSTAEVISCHAAFNFSSLTLALNSSLKNLMQYLRGLSACNVIDFFMGMCYNNLNCLAYMQIGKFNQIFGYG